LDILAVRFVRRAAKLKALFVGIWTRGHVNEIHELSIADRDRKAGVAHRSSNRSLPASE
jgi:hypothetical protein